MSSYNPDQVNFVVNEDGVHLVDFVDCDYTLCGEGLEIVEGKKVVGHRVHDTRKKTVTCPHCIRILKIYHDVKYRDPEAA